MAAIEILRLAVPDRSIWIDDRSEAAPMIEDIACITGGSLLIASAFWLSRMAPPDWTTHGELLDESQRAIARWATLQRVVRGINNFMVAIIGGAIAAAAFVPHTRYWMLLWCAILAAVMFCIFLAMLDAFSSLAGYRRALPEAARRSFAEEQDDPTT